LHWFTPAAWAGPILQHPIALLIDHAYLERKAANNALQLLDRWPEPGPPETWTIAMASIARDEAEHLDLVIKVLHRRGGRMTRPHRNRYAAELRELVRWGEGTDEVVDRLMVSALIEARSCERFQLLAAASDDAELVALYGDLGISEAGHYRVFLSLARHMASAEAVEARWQEMLASESRIIQAQPVRPALHSGVAAGQA
jgi:tRNA-(ms[2]io[6]A)-hydroxylase